MKTLLLTLSLLATSAQAARFVVEADVKPAIQGAKVEVFYPTTHAYFSRLYVVSGNVTASQLYAVKGVKLVEVPTELTTQSIVPVDGPRRLVSDELFPYQWGLSNQGQTYLREKDDIHNVPMKGVSGKDVGWEGLLSSIPEQRPVIAVLDSGVDLNHPELAGNLWKNTEECGKDPKVDNDGNKLPGDCHGWNFTESLETDDAKDVSDSDGHGTHVSGIIAAASNGRGIVGVLPNALIMPIKVMKDGESRSDVPSSEAFARGIMYAVDNGAQVINMSLGWPRALETKFLREAVYYALGQGVAIVAAAGNNNSAEPLFPCAYEGVICVAASTLDGGFAGFSNYGGHVDVVAPGEAILGLHPTLYEPDFFSVPGFEIRSGTSQATPMVAGLIGALYAKNPKITIDELFARLYSLTKAQDKKKYVLGGAATYADLAQEVSGPVVRPVLKRVRQVLFRDGASRLMIPIRNFGLLSGDVEVSVESLSSALAVTSGPQTVTGLEQGKGAELPFELKLLNPEGESHIALKITLKEGERVHSYLNEIPVVRDVSREREYKKVAFSYLEKQLPVGIVKDGALVSNLSTVETYARTPKHEMFLRRTVKEGEKKTLEVTLFSREGDLMKQAPKLILVENGLSLVNFIRVDLNQDGSEDYFLQTVTEKDGKKGFTFSFYNNKLEALWPSFQNVSVTIDLFIQSMSDLTFVANNHPKLGKMLVPAFYSEGQLPKIDQVVTSWDRLDLNKKKRLYYLEPQENVFRVRALTTNVWEDSIKKELKTKWYETVETEQVLPASAEDQKRGAVRALVTVGFGSKRKIMIATFTGKNTTHGAALPQLVLQTESVDPLMAVTAQGLQVVGDVYFNIYDRERSKLVTTAQEAQSGEFVYRHKSEFDLIAGHIASFSVGSKRFSVLQTREELVSVTRGAGEKVSHRPKLRYSFLSQKLLTEMYHPVAYERAGSLAPGLYVDGTAVTGNRISVLEEQNGALVSSIRNSIAVPGNCRAQNPWTGATGAYDFVFLCLEANNEWTLRTYKMN